MKKQRVRRRAQGFSLIEVTVVLAISIVVCAISVMSLVPMLNSQRTTNAYNTTISALRLARDNAVSQRTSYSVTFSSAATPNTITVAPTLSTYQGAQSSVTYQLPNNVTFMLQSQFSSVTAPDGFGSGSVAIDFGYTPTSSSGGSQTLYFCPDGSAQNDSTGKCQGSWDSGVVYISRAGDLMSSRAITVWGGTGRIHGWRFYSNGGSGYQWVRQ